MVTAIFKWQRRWRRQQGLNGNGDDEGGETLEDESELTALKKMDLICQRQPRADWKKEKREVHLFVQKMNHEERDRLKNTLLEMKDNADEDN
jgi:hypothetical protein